MSKHQTKLTSVILIEEIYKKFKSSTVNSNINLQKLVNRAIDLYSTNNEFKKTIENHNNLTKNGSKF
jgi:hypothetical protein